MRMKTQNQRTDLQKTLLECLNLKQNEKSSPAQIADFPQNLRAKKGVAIVCFGTPKVSGDAFGPLVADLLRDEYSVPAFVYGTTDVPIVATNMAKSLDFVRDVHKDDLIVAVDASLGDNIGGVVVRNDGVCPAAVKGRKKRFGDVGVLGVVAKKSDDPMISLLAADFSFVETLAREVAGAINAALA